MTLEKNLIFFPGGPGFSACAERAMLDAPCREAGLRLLAWDEPSARRPHGPPFDPARGWDNLLGHAEAYFLEHSQEPALLVGHSFGAQVVTRLAARHPKRIAKLVYVTPGLSLVHADKNIFAAVRDDWASRGDTEKASKMDAILASYTGGFDRNVIDGFLLAETNPRLFDRYWHRKDAMAEYLGHYQGAYAIDADAFIAVRQSLPALDGGHVPSKARIILGAHEAIIDVPFELSIARRRHAAVDVRTFEGSAHYPHIEEPDAFLRVLLEA